jgi:hypothetical protein
MSIKQQFLRNLSNLPGWRTNRKIIVIESDDWGSIRMSSKEAYSYFLSKGYPVDKCHFNRFDALESENDLSCLFEVLNSVRDNHGHPAILTANSVVANPDFEKIENSGFEQYFFEPLTITYQRYNNHSESFKIFKQGINAGLVMPQFHGREHLNVNRWMHSLKQGNKVSLDAFGKQMFSVHQPFDPGNKNEYMDALDFDAPTDKKKIENIVCDGLNLFNQIWGFQSESFIAPCNIWHKTLENKILEEGVKYIQGMAVQRQPIAEPGTFHYNRRYRYLGQKNINNQYQLVRNAFFEPSQNQSFDWVSDCLKRIETAFRWNKPAIICSHRVNYIGYIDNDNRERNLFLLKILLNGIIEKWPDVEFLSSDKLGKLISL